MRISGREKSSLQQWRRNKFQRAVCRLVHWKDGLFGTRPIHRLSICMKLSQSTHTYTYTHTRAGSTPVTSTTLNMISQATLYFLLFCVFIFFVRAWLRIQESVRGKHTNQSVYIYVFGFVCVNWYILCLGCTLDCAGEKLLQMNWPQRSSRRPSCTECDQQREREDSSLLPYLPPRPLQYNQAERGKVPLINFFFLMISMDRMIVIV